MAVTMERAVFQAVVRKAVSAMPRSVRMALENVDICVAARPSPNQRHKAKVRKGEVLLGLYEGVPQSKRDTSYGLTLPDKITLFQREIENVSATLQAAESIIQDTVWHEFAHHVGFDEDQVREMEKYQKKR